MTVWAFWKITFLGRFPTWKIQAIATARHFVFFIVLGTFLGYYSSTIISLGDFEFRQRVQIPSEMIILQRDVKQNKRTTKLFTIGIYIVWLFGFS